MTDSPRVRQYTAADRDAVWRVHDAALREAMAEYDPEYNRYLRHVERAFLDAGGEFLVAELSADDEDDPRDGAGSGDHDSRDGAERGDPDTLVGIGGFQPLDTDGVPDGALDELGGSPESDDSSVAHVRSVAVLPDAQSRGVGTALMAELHDRARDRGFGAAVLSTTPSLTDAHRFYEERGYEEVAVERDADGDVTHYWYGRDL